ncbi:hypothetical protein [Micromonospora haikouensis]|uniref:hypothetical protein n=1 Tax=Micromonospora haikouensis TaxID=686309 RepID=UPI000B874D01|nr:hypothetical protein [Micromonospora haikouensis]
MEKWEYGQLFTVRWAEPVFVFQTASNRQVFTAHMLATFDALGAEGWIVDPPGQVLFNPPQWLVDSSRVDSGVAGSPSSWTMQFARRKVA